ncbi:MAG TPA: hypothetical protein VKU19_27440 [Bryobacteraceae bacterium]|nr:hypothetical protein [Bryobacteraceae bacterium]
MRRSLVSKVAMLGGGAIGLATRSFRRTRRLTAGDIAMRRLTTYFIIPIWVGAAFIDYLWHRRTHIETTSGLEESMIHSLMMAEGLPVVLAALFLEINAGVLAGIISLTVVHEATVLWDLWFTTPRRAIPAGEQVTHTFLETPPFLVAAAAIATHWDDFQELLGRRGERDFAIRWQSPPVPPSTILAVFGALTLFGVLPHLDELRRCVDSRRQGLTGIDSPPCLAEVYDDAAAS